ncbi:MAG: RNA polymerase sigma factor [Acidobacteria bacterium]|nr:RNA polymerase sigma factor [Acidobacteriota bacterium]
METPERAASFHEIYERHGRSVYRFALYLSGDATLAEDITAETFLRLWGAQQSIVMETVKGYLLAIARNVYLQERKRAGRFTELPETIADSRSTSDAAEARQQLRRTLEWLQRLPESDRAALLMRAEQELPYEEIARALGISLSLAKVKVHRARLRLAEWRLEEGVGHEHHG